MSSSPANPSYKYEALDGPRSFRLLKLKRGGENDPLECELQIYELQIYELHASGFHHRMQSSVPDFQALSYVWGLHPPTLDIRCNGKPLRITESLQHALRLVRRRDREIFVWADAICINQSDLKERKQQVALMRSIFSKATMVSVCLNLDGTMSMRNQRFLARMLRSFDFRAEPGRRSQKLEFTTSWVRQGRFQINVRLQDPDRPTNCTIRIGGRAPTPFDDQSRKIAARDFPSQFGSVLATFFDNPWFSRIWVVQEVDVSEQCRVLLGNQKIPWRNVVWLAHWLVFRDTRLRARVLQLTKTNGVRNVLFMHSGTIVWAPDPIPALLQSTRDFGASDPRDKVYAVLHKPLKRTFIFTKFRFLPLSKYVQLFVQAASLLCLLSATFARHPTEMSFWSMLLSLGYIAYLQFLQLGKAIVWDFGQRLMNFCLTVDRVLLHRYKYSDTLQNALSLTADYSLTVQTVYRTVAKRVIERTRKLDILSYVNHGSDIDIIYPSWVPRWDMPTHGMDVLISLPRLQFQASANINHNLSHSPRPDDHLVVEGLRFSIVSWTSDVIDSARDDKAAHTRPMSRPMSIASSETLAASQFAQSKHLLASHARNTHHYNYQSAKLTPAQLAHGRRRFLTENGSLGMGPCAMKTGDIVCVLFGGRVPYILRATDADDLYRVVGESYVYGIMMGKAIDMWRGGILTKESFTLC
ncbi:hypothetical protein DL765_006146 [Monosporascus sp. GIB2]|nr:hypothetical protein DL765_006146 [Monosporascus sp. GIB2]